MFNRGGSYYYVGVGELGSHQAGRGHPINTSFEIRGEYFINKGPPLPYILLCGVSRVVKNPLGLLPLTSSGDKHNMTIRNLTVTWKRTGQTSDIELSTKDRRLVVKFNGTGNTFITKKQFDDTREVKFAMDWLEMHLKSGKEFPWGPSDNSKWEVEDTTIPCPF